MTRDKNLPALRKSEESLQLFEEVVVANRELVPFNAAIQDERSAEVIFDFVESLPISDRVRVRRKLKRIVRELEAERKANESRATLSKTIGTVLGGALATGSIIALASNPFAWPLLAVAVAGSGTAITGLAVGHRIDKVAINQDLTITLIEDMLGDLENV